MFCFLYKQLLTFWKRSFLSFVKFRPWRVWFLIKNKFKLGNLKPFCFTTKWLSSHNFFKNKLVDFLDPSFTEKWKIKFSVHQDGAERLCFHIGPIPFTFRSLPQMLALFFPFFGTFFATLICFIGTSICCWCWPRLGSS